MKVAKWALGIAAGLLLLAVALVLVVTLLVDPNRFKPRVERLVQEATGKPFTIRGDLGIAWYPWLALQMGAAQLGDTPSLVQWEKARVGAKLIPLLRGTLVIDRVRLDGLHLRLERYADGRGNWADLLSARQQSASGNSTPQLGGLEIRNGSFEYQDATGDMHISVSEWRLDVSEWRTGEPVSLQSQFNLGQGARFSVSGSLESTTPVKAQGHLTVETASLRRLLADLGMGGPRPQDARALAAMKTSLQWAADGGIVTVKPIEVRLDQTRFTGEIARSAEPDPLWSFSLAGDQIDLDRYLALEETDSEPFELPVTALKALRARGVVSFARANLSTAQMKDVRITLELQDGRLSGVQSVP